MKGLIPAARAALRRVTGSRASLEQSSDRFKRCWRGQRGQRGQLAITALLVILLTMMGCVQGAMAADVGSCVYSGLTLGDNNVDSVRYYRYLCTAHTDGSLSVTLSVTPMSGRTCTKFITTPVVASTDNSDLAITGNGVTVVAAAGQGANMIDATSTLWNYFEGPSADGSENGYYEPTSGKNATVAVTNNIVSQSSFYLDFICY